MKVYNGPTHIINRMYQIQAEFARKLGRLTETEETLLMNELDELSALYQEEINRRFVDGNTP